jgi:ribonuclease G
VLIDQPSAHREMQEFAAPSCPRRCRASNCMRPAPVFELHHVEEEIQKALDRKVPLKSGGHLIIDQTEAMTTIDVNTGAFVGHRNLEETIFRTNLEAAVTIAGSCACAIWAASSSSISSTWRRRIIAAR